MEGSIIKKEYDLEKRTSAFSKDIITLAKKIPRSLVNNPLVSQLVRSGTSIGANYCEADCAESRKDFEHKIGICKKESKETIYWLDLILHAEPYFEQDIKPLLKEVTELKLIFIAIVRKSKSNNP